MRRLLKLSFSQWFAPSRRQITERPPRSRARAGVYLRDEQLFIVADAQTRSGLWIAQPPVCVVNASDATQAGLAVERCLAASTQTIPDPDSFEGLFRPILQASGAASYADFARSAKHVGVMREADEVAVTPYDNLGRRDGFEPQATALRLAAPSPTALGEAVGEALERASKAPEKSR